MIYTHSLDYTITSEHTEIPVQTARLETRVPGVRPASPANNTRDYYGNLHHTISIVVQKATLTPTIKRETIYTNERHYYVGKHSPSRGLEERICDLSFVNGPSRAKRHRGTLPRSLFPVVSDNDRFVIKACSHKMSLKRKSSAGADFSHLGCIFIGRRDRRRCTERIRSSPIGVYASEAGEPICTIIES